MSADDIRKSLRIVESSDVKETEMAEAAPMGFFKKLATAAAAMVSDVKLGELETGSVANNYYKEYMRYLGLIGKKPGQGDDVGDLFDFLIKVGIPMNVVLTGMSAGLAAPIRTKEDLQKWWNTQIQTDYKNKIGKVFLNVVQASAKLPTQELDPEDFAKRGVQGATASASLEKGAAPQAKEKPVTRPAPKVTPQVKIPVGTPDDVAVEMKKNPSIIDQTLKTLGAS